MRTLALLLGVLAAGAVSAHPGRDPGAPRWLPERTLEPELPSPAGLGEVLVQQGSAMRWLANSADPGLGLDWVQPGFDDGAWTPGTHGAGYEASSGAEALIATEVPIGTLSLYTRTEFEIDDPASVANLLLAADWDDGWAAWINGVEVHRSAQMPAGPLDWDADAGLSESSNAAAPVYWPVVDVSAEALPALVPGRNVLAAAVWNTDAGSSDLLLVPQLRRDVATRIVRGPYLQQTTPDSAIVRWRTAAPTPTVLRAGPAGQELDRLVSDPAPVFDHEVLLDSLGGRRHWTYVIEDDPQPRVRTFRTPPPAGTREPFRTWVIGDSGTGDANARAVRDAWAARHGPERTDVWLLLGDNAYENGSDPDYQRTFFDVYEEIAGRVAPWPTLGNHDGRSADSADGSGTYYDIFTLPRAGEAGGVASGTEAWYAFDHANVHFVCLDSFDSDRSPGSEMLTWLAADLAATTQDWIVAYWHHPPYSKGSHDSDTESELVDMRENAVPVLEAAGVDLVLCGHSHSYERSVLIDDHLGPSASFGPRFVLDGGDGRPLGDGEYAKSGDGPTPHEGAVFAVAGSSGKTSAGPLDHPAMFVSLLELGSLVLEFDGLRLDASFLDAAGDVRDSFTIVKGCRGEPCFERDCTDGVDEDGDSLVDADDPDCVPTDRDGDGVADGEDCDPGRAGSWARPRSVGTLLVQGPGALLRWTDASPASGTETVHDVLGGRVSELHRDGGPSGASCLIGDLRGGEALDGEPARADPRWYLVRARNACGASPLGASSLGERVLPPLPCP